ncbi:uncharacterized protein [Notamacropus eugenii]|uniref:uncharacterized protein isoform X1 n=1 Tax=Notamacropus eugenii TaxID=9315 RepID=UPI003B67058A
MPDEGGGGRRRRKEWKEDSLNSRQLLEDTEAATKHKRQLDTKDGQPAVGLNTVLPQLTYKALGEATSSPMPLRNTHTKVMCPNDTDPWLRTPSCAMEKEYCPWWRGRPPYYPPSVPRGVINCLVETASCDGDQLILSDSGLETLRESASAEILEGKRGDKVTRKCGEEEEEAWWRGQGKRNEGRGRAFNLTK